MVPGKRKGKKGSSVKWLWVEIGSMTGLIHAMLDWRDVDWAD
jgi:hypothetical protein